MAPEKKTLSISQEQVNNNPYYQILAKTTNTESILILTRISANFFYWQTGSQESLVIANGLIYRTTGLTNNLEQTRFTGENPFVTGLHKISDKTTASRIIDLSGYRYGIRINSVFHIRKYESLTILDQTRRLLLIEETVSAPDIHLQATNHYWIDDSGFIWKSEQTLWPDFSITITQLRPYKDATP